jgi:hypothetical protein
MKNRLRRLIQFLFILSLSTAARAQTFTESKHPIVIITTNDGATIPDDPKIFGTIKIIYRGEGQITYLTDESDSSYIKHTENIGIELRGSSSQLIKKKPYSFETMNATNTDTKNVSLLGLPSENDWILNNMAFDPAYVRDYLAYSLSRQLGQYSARTIYCEVLINGDYKGLYMLQEKLKDDGNRINIEKLAATDDTPGTAAITGAYIIQGDRQEVSGDNFYMSGNTGGVSMIYELPKASAITSNQKTYIQSIFSALASKTSNDSKTDGFPSIIDVQTFVDYMLLNELTSNVDVYQISTYFHKDKGGKLRAGPVWDFNASLGRDLWLPPPGRSATDAWQFSNGDNEGPHFFKGLFENATFKCYMAKRWNELIQPGQPFNLTTLNTLLDGVKTLITESAARNLQRWPDSDEDEGNRVNPGTLEEEMNLVKTFLTNRITWITNNIGSATACSGVTVPQLVINEIMYNPSGAEETDEFIEIKNTGNTSADLTGVFFSTLGISYQFPAGTTVAPGGFIVVTSDLAGYASKYPGAPTPVGAFSRKLPNSSHKLVLSDAFGNFIDEVHYYDSAPWPTTPDGDGQSLELTSSSLDNNDAASWFARAVAGGTPGAENFSPLPVTLVKFTAHEEESGLVTLYWDVTDEVKMEGYVVENSFDGKNFTRLGEVEAVEKPSYSFLQERPSSGLNYYRLKMNELDGKFAYSKIVSVNVKKGADMFFFPNPTTDKVYITIRPEIVDQSATIRILSMDGEELYSKKNSVLTRTESLDCSNLSSGRYLIVIESVSGVFSRAVDVVR